MNGLDTSGTAAKSTAEFTAWLDAAAPGETFTYHVGVLAAERKDWTDGRGRHYQAVPGLDKLATAISKAAERGDCSLRQRRLGRGRYEYLAKRTAAQTARACFASYGKRLIELRRAAA